VRQQHTIPDTRRKSAAQEIEQHRAAKHEWNETPTVQPSVLNKEYDQRKIPSHTIKGAASEQRDISKLVEPPKRAKLDESK
jgi:hypothetical protein